MSRTIVQIMDWMLIFPILIHLIVGPTRRSCEWLILIAAQLELCKVPNFERTNEMGLVAVLMYKYIFRGR